ncbi:MAG: fimbrillin family protein [Prevotella sp.]
MMKTKNILFIALMAVALMGCSSDEETGNAPVAAQIYAEIANAASTRITDNGAWQTGDAIGVTVESTEGKTTGTNVKYYRRPYSTVFYSDTPIYYMDGKKVTFKAYYPYTTDDVVEKTITADDETTEDARSQIDYLFASGARGDIQSPDVEFSQENSFQHCMSQISLTFKAGDGVTDLSALTSYTVDGLVMTGTFTPADGIAMESSTATASPLVIPVTDASGTSYVASPLILFPQSPASGSFVLTVVFGGITYKATLALPSEKLSPGRRVAYNITINRTGISVGNGTIEDWQNTDFGIYTSEEAEQNGIVPAERMVDLDLKIVMNGTTYKVYFANSNLAATDLADSEGAIGDYFAWGAVEPWYNIYTLSGVDNKVLTISHLAWKSGKEAGYTAENAPYYDAASETYTKYTAGDQMDVMDDVARQILGGKWQIPPIEVWQVLKADTNMYKWNDTVIDGRKGVMISKRNDADTYIFLPGVGLLNGTNGTNMDGTAVYWSNTISGSSKSAKVLYTVGTVNVQTSYSYYRHYGMPIRPVILEAI